MAHEPRTICNTNCIVAETSRYLFANLTGRLKVGSITCTSFQLLLCCVPSSVPFGVPFDRLHMPTDMPIRYLFRHLNPPFYPTD